MAVFQAGQNVIYRNIGVCEVEAVGAKSFCGEKPKEYYTLRLLYTKGNDRLYVPTSTDAFLRPITGPEQAESYLETLEASETPVFCSRNQPALVEHYQQMFQTNDLLDHLKLYKEICCKEQMQKSRGRKLNAVDQHFYHLPEQLLSEEFAVSLCSTPLEMRKKLRAAALS